MKDASLAFVRAVSWGSLAGGGPFLVISIPLALGFEVWQPEAVWLAVMPVVIAAAVVTLAATVLGLPLTAWLASQKDEDAVSYALAGLGLGALLPIVIGLALSGGWSVAFFLAIPGALAGTVTGTSWGRWRERIAGPAQP